MTGCARIKMGLGCLLVRARSQIIASLCGSLCEAVWSSELAANSRLSANDLGCRLFAFSAASSSSASSSASSAVLIFDIVCFFVFV